MNKLKNKRKNNNSFSVHRKHSDGSKIRQTHSISNENLPIALQRNLEAVSGFDFSNIRVHKNSSKPLGVGALAYTKGLDIYLAPSQEHLLPHESWHVVQQMQQKVRKTNMVNGEAINSESSLENEADKMGKYLAILKPEKQSRINSKYEIMKPKSNNVIQRAVYTDYDRDIYNPLTRRLRNWQISDKECKYVVNILVNLSEKDLMDTYYKMQGDGTWSNLYKETPEKYNNWQVLLKKINILGSKYQPTLTDVKSRITYLQSVFTNCGRVLSITSNIIGDKTKTGKQLLFAKKQIEKISAAVGKLKKKIDVASDVKNVYNAIRKLEKIDVSKNPKQAAKAFDELFLSLGKLGNHLPPGPWSGYFDFLAQSKNFFSNMRQILVASERHGGIYRPYF